jgi:pimeloyl-ACP methyl ester carboxylesterase
MVAVTLSRPHLAISYRLSPLIGASLCSSSRAPGRTADIEDRPFSFEQSADDTAALLKHLDIHRADLFGFSNSGTIALQVAIRYPQLVAGSL